MSLKKYSFSLLAYRPQTENNHIFCQVGVGATRDETLEIREA